MSTPNDSTTVFIHGRPLTSGKGSIYVGSGNGSTVEVKAGPAGTVPTVQSDGSIAFSSITTTMTSIGSTISPNGPFYPRLGYGQIAGGSSSFRILTFADAPTVSLLSYPTPTPPAAPGWGAPVVAANGDIYAAPYSTAASTVLKIAPGDIVSEFGSVGSGDSKWMIGALASNGRIYYAPFGSGVTAVLKIDPTTDTVTTFGSLGTGKYCSLVRAPNGFLYGMPALTTTNVLKLNPTNDTTSTFGTISAGGRCLGNGVLAPNGAIYCGGNGVGVPFLKIDTTTDTVTTFGSASNAIAAGILVGNFIYFFGTSSTVKIDTTTDTVTTVFTGTSVQGFSPVVRMPDGNMYFGSGGSQKKIFKLDPVTDALTGFVYTHETDWNSNFSGSGSAAGSGNNTVYFLQNSRIAKFLLQ